MTNDHSAPLALGFGVGYSTEARAVAVAFRCGPFELTIFPLGADNARELVRALVLAADRAAGVHVAPGVRWLGDGDFLGEIARPKNAP